MIRPFASGTVPPRRPRPASRWHAVRRAPLATALLRPDALVILLALCCVQIAGGWRALDRTAWSGLGSALPLPDRAAAPVVVAIDDATVARLGAPPWDQATWSTVRMALARQDVEEVVLADPWPRLVRLDDAAVPAHDAGAVVKVPAVVWDGRDAPPLGTDELPPPAWLVPEAASLAIASPGTDPGSVLEQPPAPWLPCTLGVPCASRGGGAWPLRAVDVSVVPLAALLDANRPFLAAHGHEVLLGVTATQFAERARAGTEARRVPWVVATARALGSARHRTPWMPLSTAGDVAWIMAAFVAGAALSVRFASRSVLVVAPALAASAAVVVAGTLGVVQPMTGMVVAALAPVLAREAGMARASVVGLRRLALLVVRAASRAGTLRRRITTMDELLDVLADLTRSHGREVPFSLLAVRAGQVQLAVHGGYSLGAGHFDAKALRIDHPDVASAAEAWHGIESTAMLRDGRTVRLVPLFQGGFVVALWCLTMPDGEDLPDARRIGRLAQWVGERLALPHVPGAFVPEQGVLPEDPADDAMENLFLAADEERRRWMTTVQSLGMPVIVADVAGRVTSQNPPMTDALQACGIGRVRSLRELAYQATGEEGLAMRMRRLFVDNRSVGIPLPGPGERLLVLRPVAVEREDDAERSPLLGYVGWIVAADTQHAADWDGQPTLDGMEDATELYLPRLGSP